MRRVRWNCVHADRERRFSLEIDEESGRTFVAIPVSNRMADYLEWYEVGAQQFARFRADPDLAFAFAERARRRELDHLLLLPPGTDRGEPW
jgi:hypothetical protein